MSKGSNRRPYDKQKFAQEWDRIFGKKEAEMPCKGKKGKGKRK